MSQCLIHIHDISNSLSLVLIGIIWEFINIPPKFFPIPWFFHVAIITRYPHYYTGHVKLVFGIKIRVKKVLKGISGATWTKIIGQFRLLMSLSSWCKYGFEWKIDRKMKQGSTIFKEGTYTKTMGYDVNRLDQWSLAWICIMIEAVWRIPIDQQSLQSYHLIFSMRWDHFQ